MAEAATLHSRHYNQPRAIVVPEMPEDELLRARASRLIRRAGALALESSFEQPEINTRPTSSYGSLHEAIQCAAGGDEEALRLVTANVTTETLEQTIKAGLIIETELSVDEQFKIWQYGQSMEDVSINSLRYASAQLQIRRRAEAETRNGTRIEHFNRQGLLEEYYFVVISRAADDMSPDEMEGVFFTDTMSCAIQATQSVGGNLSIESAFVAGAASLGAERHDTETVIALGNRLGVDLASKNATEIIDTPLLIPKHLMPNGVIDLVRLYDETSGRGTFFGQDKPVQDYTKFREFCRQREAEYQPRVDEIVSQLLAEANTLQTPNQATRLLHELSQAQMVDHAIVDLSIDPRVFGPAAEHINEARYWRAAGDSGRLLDARNSAQITATSTSCPISEQQRQMEAQNSLESDSSNSRSEGSSNAKIRCIKCREYVSKDQVIKKDCWECPRCNHKVDICNGAILNEGETNRDKNDKTAKVVSLLEKLNLTQPDVGTESTEHHDSNKTLK